MTDDQRRILIAGGGPVGLLCAWLIGRHGLPVRLFDNNGTLQADPRAATTHPATLDLLDEALVADMARVGLVAPIFQFWDRPSQKLVAQFDHAVLKDDTRHPFDGCSIFPTSRCCSITKSSTWRSAPMPSPCRCATDPVRSRNTAVSI